MKKKKFTITFIEEETTRHIIVKALTCTEAISTAAILCAEKSKNPAITSEYLLRECVIKVLPEGWQEKQFIKV